MYRDSIKYQSTFNSRKKNVEMHYMRKLLKDVCKIYKSCENEKFESIFKFN